ncbi:ef-hand domain-containing protein [Tribonema minus]|uniref:Ef-hand domain-containing protein n=1 Tax=Tribonema minus TaxID=303371 RepID=A0A835Z5Q7_9STRA|nr:ef-hand domain-containing protein [Tribonema minus]
MYASHGSLPDLPMVPGIYRAPNGYLKSCTGQGLGGSGMSCAGSVAPRSTVGPRPGTALGTHHGVNSKKVPSYITKEGQVLRFRAYFQEPVYEGGSVDAAGFRVRVFAVNYHLSDETMAIEEPRVQNSGLTQGKFMKRTKVERPRGVGGGVYQPADFCVGEEIWVYGRRFRIVDADARTREWYRENLGLEQGPAEDVPDDGYARERQRFEVPKQTEAGLPLGTGSGVAAGGAVTGGAAARAVRREKGEYFKKDRKVLRFFCRYEDQRLQGDKRDYVLYYYLLNDTVEVKEVAAEGRHNFPNLLRRQKLPRDSLHVPTSYGGTVSPRDGEREPMRAVTWQDLK